MRESTAEFELRAWREQFIVNWGKQHRCLQPVHIVDSVHLKTTYHNNQRLSCKTGNKGSNKKYDTQAFTAQRLQAENFLWLETL